MNKLLRRLLAPLACVAVLGAFSTAANADLVTSRFNGTVSGYEFGFLDQNSVAFDNDHPIGTAVQWDLTFDDSFLGLGLNDLFGVVPMAVSGSLLVGSDQYTFTSMRFFSLTFQNDFSTILEYRPQVSATGPGTSDGGDFFSMFWSFAPDLSLASAAMIGYGYSNGFGTAYGYLTTSGEYSVGPASQVPEPATALLALPALWWLRRRRQA